jgi:hypothetical protein
MRAKKTSKTTKTTSQTSSELRLSFPLAADWKALVERFHLDSAQEEHLKIVLQHVINDLDHFRTTAAKIPRRSQLVTRLKRLEKLFGSVASELKKAEKDLPHLLPHNVGGFIGRTMTFTSLGDALGRDQFPISVDLEVERMIAAMGKVGQKTIDRFGEPRREALGLTHSHILLPYLINGIYEPLHLWVELDRKNKGGRTPNMLRRYLAYWIIYNAENIMNKRPTISQLGKFVEFCEAVFEACRLPSDGLDKIMPALVKKVREDKKAHVEIISSPDFKLRILVEKPQ